MPDSAAAQTPSPKSRLEVIERRLQRERLARREGEEIAERTTRALYDKQQELVLLEAVVAASNESSTVADALRAAVDAVGVHTGWPLGHAYVRAPSGDLVPTGSWHIAKGDQFAAFRRMTEQTTFAAGIGLPGRVLATGRAAWVTDVTIDANFPRKDLGVRGAFAFPIYADEELNAVLEFFSAAAVAPDPGLLGVMAQIGRYLGRVLERIRAQEKIAHQATHDPLTGLANRLLFRDRVELALARAKRQSSFAALVFLDLDRFKEINDGLGHSAGDQLLMEVSNRLQAVFRATDTVVRTAGDEPFMLARFGGDEFVVLCEDLTSASGAVRVAERIQQALLDPFRLERTECAVTASIGIVVTSGAGGDAESLLRDADIAMYRAKQRGPGNWEIFDVALRSQAVERVATERALGRALDAGELRLHYQPIVSLDDGTVRSVEALVRWQHPERGLLAPEAFIPIAEQTAFILRIDAWTLREACKQAHHWRAHFGDAAPLPVSVNVSARQLAQPTLPEIVRQILAQTGLCATDLAIEVTEVALIDDTGVTAASLGDLDELGVKILLDDFGTGLSSLSHLREFPVDMLKIDRSFVMHLDAGNDECTVVRAIAAMASALGLDVVAEGVETARQAEQARALGCGWAQGHHFAHPASAAEIETLIRSGVNLPAP